MVRKLQNLMFEFQNTNSMLPAGYRHLKQQVEFNLDPQNNQHFKPYEQRLLRTDDIQGAKPKSYGNIIPQNAYAGTTESLKPGNRYD